MKMQVNWGKPERAPHRRYVQYGLGSLSMYVTVSVTSVFDEIL